MSEKFDSPIEKHFCGATPATPKAPKEFKMPQWSEEKMREMAAAEEGFIGAGDTPYNRAIHAIAMAAKKVEVAGEKTDYDILIEAYPDARIWEHAPGDWQVAAGFGGEIKTYGHKTAAAAISTVASRIKAMGCSKPTPQPEPAATEHLSVVELCLKHENLGEYIAQVESQLAVKDAVIGELREQLKLSKSAYDTNLKTLEWNHQQSMNEWDNERFALEQQLSDLREAKEQQLIGEKAQDRAEVYIDRLRQADILLSRACAVISGATTDRDQWRQAVGKYFERGSGG